MSNSKLKPCPFCGSTVNIIYNSLDNAYKAYHDKGECKFIEPFYIDGEHAESLAEAYRIWNTRSGV